jgi:hypothetical protein
MEARGVAVGLALALALLAPAPVRAGDSFLPRAGAGGRSYGWQILAADGAGFALVVVASATDDGSGAPNAWLLGSLAVWGIGAPSLHLLQRQPRRAATSLALRWGLSLGLAGLMSLWREDEPEPACEPCWLPEGDRAIPMVVGFVVGGVAAQAIDWLYLARRPGPPRPAAALVAAAMAGGPGLAVVGRW